MAETDIVERARADAASFSLRADDAGRLSKRIVELADEIERLRARAEAAERALSNARAEVWTEAAALAYDMARDERVEKFGELTSFAMRVVGAALRTRAEHESGQ